MRSDNNEKVSAVMIEDINNDEFEKKAPVKVDYSGASEKTDPAEIALVRKLDIKIMGLLWAMYWLNYLDRNAIALARLNTLEADLKLQGTGKSSIMKLPPTSITPLLTLYRVPHLCQYFIRRLHSRRYSQQHALDQSKTQLLPGLLYGSVGHCLSSNSLRSGLRWLAAHTFLPWFDRSALL